MAFVPTTMGFWMVLSCFSFCVLFLTALCNAGTGSTTAIITIFALLYGCKMRHKSSTNQDTERPGLHARAASSVSWCRARKFQAVDKASWQAQKEQLKLDTLWTWQMRLMTAAWQVEHTWLPRNCPWNEDVRYSASRYVLRSLAAVRNHTAYQVE